MSYSSFTASHVTVQFFIDVCYEKFSSRDVSNVWHLMSSNGLFITCIICVLLLYVLSVV
jgi:hypothetical protein